MRGFAVLFVLAACSSDDAPLPEDFGECEGLVEGLRPEAGIHMPVGTPISWSSNPPAIGAHYPTWAGWDRHYQQLDRGYYVHNLEHGGVVLLYNCPTGCPEVIESLLDLARNAAPDPTCAAPVRNRIIVAADPLMPPTVQVAAVAWGQVYTASCFDPYVGTFMRRRYRHGTEDTCADGNPMSGALITP